MTEILGSTGLYAPGADSSAGPGRYQSQATGTTKILVAGTPYAGASVIGQALAEAGLYLPGPTGMAATNDAAGIFINRAMASLHNELLGTGWLDQAVSTSVRTDDERRQRVRALLDAEAGLAAGWAMLDPRAALFTGLWDEVVPDARWIFIVRSPAQTAWVFLRRRVFADEPSPQRRVALALDVWNRYATAIAAFCAKRRDRTALLLAPEDFGPEGDASIAALTLGDVQVTLGHAYHHLLLRNSSPAWVRLQTRLHRQASATMAVLGDIRHRQRKERGLTVQQSRPRAANATPPRPTVCIASRRRFPVSETFIRDHLRQLPASRWLIGGRGDVKRDSNDLPVSSALERGLAAGLTEFGHTGMRMETRAVARYLRRAGVDVVVAEFGPVAVEYMDACQRAGVPMVAHFHGYDAYKTSTLAEHHVAYRRLFGIAGALVVVSRSMARQLESLGAPADRIVWSPCGVDTNAFAGATPERAGPLFVSVGRFVEKKAPHNVLLAFHHLAMLRPEARLVMVGDGVMLASTRLLCDALGLGGRVQFTGPLPPAAVAAHLRSARAFVQHSIVDAEGNAEGTPVSVLEAGSSGLPVVATRHMGIADVILHSETGFLLDEGDVRTMGEHLVTLCDDPGLAGSMGRRARERVRDEFSVECATGRLWSAIELAIANGAKRRA